jgi:hypothetical protein
MGYQREAGEEGQVAVDGIGGVGDIPGFKAEPAVAADGAGTTAFRDITSLQPAPLLNSFVRQTPENSDANSTRELGALLRSGIRE